MPFLADLWLPGAALAASALVLIPSAIRFDRRSRSWARHLVSK